MESSLKLHQEVISEKVGINQPYNLEFQFEHIVEPNFESNEIQLKDKMDVPNWCDVCEAILACDGDLINTQVSVNKYLSILPDNDNTKLRNNLKNILDNLDHIESLLTVFDFDINRCLEFILDGRDDSDLEIEEESLCKSLRILKNFSCDDIIITPSLNYMFFLEFTNWDMDQALAITKSLPKYWPFYDELVEFKKDCFVDGRPKAKCVLKAIGDSNLTKGLKLYAAKSYCQSFPKLWGILDDLWDTSIVLDNFLWDYDSAKRYCKDNDLYITLDCIDVLA